MSGSTRIEGRQLLLEVTPPEASGPVNYWADATRVLLDNEAEFQPALGAGGEFYNVEWFIDVEAIQSTDPGSFWTFLFMHTNEEVPFVYAPHGNPEPTEDQPHFTGVLVVPNPPALGGEAGEDVTYKFESKLPIIDGPHRVTG